MCQGIEVNEKARLTQSHIQEALLSPEQSVGPDRRARKRSVQTEASGPHEPPALCRELSQLPLPPPPAPVLFPLQHRMFPQKLLARRPLGCGWGVSCLLSAPHVAVVTP